MSNAKPIEKEMNANTAMDKAQEVTDQAQQKVSDVTANAKEQAKRAATQVTEQAKTTVDTRMNDVAHEVNSVADAVRQTSQEVGEDNQTVARYGARIADQLESVSAYLGDNDIEGVLSDLQDFARRQPVVFLGGAFMLGMMVGRFVRSSATPEYDDMGDQGYNDMRYRGTTPQSSTTNYGSGSTYQGQNRYQTRLTQESTTFQDED